MIRPAWLLLVALMITLIRAEDDRRDFLICYTSDANTEDKENVEIVITKNGRGTIKTRLIDEINCIYANFNWPFKYILEVITVESICQVDGRFNKLLKYRLAEGATEVSDEVKDAVAKVVRETGGRIFTLMPKGVYVNTHQCTVEILEKKGLIQVASTSAHKH